MLESNKDKGVLDINCCDPLGRSALLMAIDNENLEIIELLLDNKVRMVLLGTGKIGKQFIDLPGWQNNDPSSGKHYSLPFLRATPSSLSRTLKGLFELTRRPSRALDSPRALLPELQRYKDTVRCAAVGAEVPGHRQQQLTQTLILCL